MSTQDSQDSSHWRYADVDDRNFHLHGRTLLLLVVLLALLLFFTLFCIYVRWACRARDSGSAHSWPGRNPVRARPGDVIGQACPCQTNPVGLGRRVIDSLPVQLHGKDRMGLGEESMCSICLSVFVEGEKVKVLPECGHVFHTACVDEWFRTQCSCPMCRATLKEFHRDADIKV
ncbi:RING-H2 finger protein ATL66-like [Asparagus officinalis]|uniref:RING-H2 finger protein ATL66-like n=1 Tax=Asparagus officinalis TaxID=4686 RepID=UPI00098E3BCA|nr:RING-H2 finger protein ATL66-like [Asparagus officinalis]